MTVKNKALTKRLISWINYHNKPYTVRMFGIEQVVNHKERAAALELLEIAAHEGRLKRVVAKTGDTEAIFFAPLGWVEPEVKVKYDKSKKKKQQKSKKPGEAENVTAGASQKPVPEEELEAILQFALCKAQELKTRLRVKDLARKVATLDKLAESPIITEDIAELLSQIRADLQELAA
jgi:hypothetical protein